MKQQIVMLQDQINAEKYSMQACHAKVAEATDLQTSVQALQQQVQQYAGVQQAVSSIQASMCCDKLVVETAVAGVQNAFSERCQQLELKILSTANQVPGPGSCRDSHTGLVSQV